MAVSTNHEQLVSLALALADYHFWLTLARLARSILAGAGILPGSINYMIMIMPQSGLVLSIGKIPPLPRHTMTRREQ